MCIIWLRPYIWTVIRVGWKKWIFRYRLGHSQEICLCLRQGTGEKMGFFASDLVIPKLGFVEGGKAKNGLRERFQHNCILLIKVIQNNIFVFQILWGPCTFVHYPQLNKMVKFVQDWMIFRGCYQRSTFHHTPNV